MPQPNKKSKTGLQQQPLNLHPAMLVASSVASTVGDNLNFVGKQAFSILSTIITEKIKLLNANSPEENNRLQKLRELEELFAKVRPIERAGAMTLIVQSKWKLNRINRRLSIIEQLTQESDPIDFLSKYRIQLIGESTNDHKLSPLFRSNVLKRVYPLNYHEKKFSNQHYLLYDIKELQILTKSAKSVKLGNIPLGRYVNTLLNVDNQIPDSKVKLFENNRVNEIKELNIPLLRILNNIEEIIFILLYSNKINSQRQINEKLNNLLEEHSEFHALLKVVFAYPAELPVMRLYVVVILELIALLTNENGTIVLLNVDSSTSELVLSNFFKYYSQKLNTILNVHESNIDTGPPEKPKASSTPQEVPSNTLGKSSDTSGQPSGTLNQSLINENLLEQNIALYVHKLQNNKQQVYNMEEGSDLDVINVFENQVEPFIRLIIPFIYIKSASDLDTFETNLSLIKFNGFNSLLKMNIFNNHLMQMKFVGTGYLEDAQPNIAPKFNRINLKKVLKYLYYGFPINYMYEALPHYWYDVNKLKYKKNRSLINNLNDSYIDKTITLTYNSLTINNLWYNLNDHSSECYKFISATSIPLYSYRCLLQRNIKNIQTVNNLVLNRANSNCLLSGTTFDISVMGSETNTLLKELENNIVKAIENGTEREFLKTLIVAINDIIKAFYKEYHYLNQEKQLPSRNNPKLDKLLIEIFKLLEYIFRINYEILNKTTKLSVLSKPGENLIKELINKSTKCDELQDTNKYFITKLSLEKTETNTDVQLLTPNDEADLLNLASVLDDTLINCFTTKQYGIQQIPRFITFKLTLLSLKESRNISSSEFISSEFLTVGGKDVHFDKTDLVVELPLYKAKTILTKLDNDLVDLMRELTSVESKPIFLDAHELTKTLNSTVDLSKDTDPLKNPSKEEPKEEPVIDSLTLLPSLIESLSQIKDLLKANKFKKDYKNVCTILDEVINNSKNKFGNNEFTPFLTAFSTYKKDTLLTNLTNIQIDKQQKLNRFQFMEILLGFNAFNQHMFTKRLPSINEFNQLLTDSQPEINHEEIQTVLLTLVQGLNKINQHILGDLLQCSYEVMLSSNHCVTKENLIHNQLKETNAYNNLEGGNVYNFNNIEHPLLVKIFKIFFNHSNNLVNNQSSEKPIIKELEALKNSYNSIDIFNSSLNIKNQNAINDNILIEIEIIECCIKASNLLNNPFSRFFKGNRLKNCIIIEYEDTDREKVTVLTANVYSHFASIISQITNYNFCQHVLQQIVNGKNFKYENNTHLLLVADTWFFILILQLLNYKPNNLNNTLDLNILGIIHANLNLACASHQMPILGLQVFINPNVSNSEGLMLYANLNNNKKQKIQLLQALFNKKSIETSEKNTAVIGDFFEKEKLNYKVFIWSNFENKQYALASPQIVLKNFVFETPPRILIHLRSMDQQIQFLELQKKALATNSRLFKEFIKTSFEYESIGLYFHELGRVPSNFVGLENACQIIQDTSSTLFKASYLKLISTLTTSFQAKLKTELESMPDLHLSDEKKAEMVNRIGNLLTTSGVDVMNEEIPLIESQKITNTLVHADLSKNVKQYLTDIEELYTTALNLIFRFIEASKETQENDISLQLNKNYLLLHYPVTYSHFLLELLIEKNAGQNKQLNTEYKLIRTVLNQTIFQKLFLFILFKEHSDQFLFNSFMKQNGFKQLYKEILINAQQASLSFDDDDTTIYDEASLCEKYIDNILVVKTEKGMESLKTFNEVAKEGLLNQSPLEFIDEATIKMGLTLPAGTQIPNPSDDANDGDFPPASAALPRPSNRSVNTQTIGYNKRVQTKDDELQGDENPVSEGSNVDNLEDSIKNSFSDAFQETVNQAFNDDTPSHEPST